MTMIHYEYIIYCKGMKITMQDVTDKTTPDELQTRAIERFKETAFGDKEIVKLNIRKLRDMP
jgi:hypothetical protein